MKIRRIKSILLYKNQDTGFTGIQEFTLQVFFTAIIGFLMLTILGI